MDRLDENIEALREHLSAPCWGVLPPGGDAVAAIDAEQLRRFIDTPEPPADPETEGL
jgi:hypothetical protein